MGRKSLTHEEFMERFYKKNENAENIEIIGEYINSSTKIKCKCKIDGYEWETIPSNLLSGHSCPKCYGNAKLTYEEFINKMKEINNDIEILGEYINSVTKIKCRCKIDEYEFEMRPSDLLNGHGCPKCASNIKKTIEEFINELKEINNNIEILGEYINNKTKIKCRCKIDGYEWEAKPNNLLKGHGCPKCYNDIRVEDKKLTHEEFVDRMKEINDNIEILGEYINSRTKIKCKCKIDGYEWEMTPNNLLSNHGCPKCNESKGEKIISKYLDNKNINYIPQHKFNDCRSKYKLPFDFYIPSKNIVIEYDGEYHYMIITRGKNDTYERAFNRFVGTKVRDTIKTIYCKENNIKLIRIPYWDFDKIEEILEKEL